MTYLNDLDKNSGGSTKSVSYTHLRAHETEADLVCRLLLEKKKNSVMMELPTLQHYNLKELNKT